jgi:outer membrane protein OmpA-like peptidoglycan-associated protein
VAAMQDTRRARHLLPGCAASGILDVDFAGRRETRMTGRWRPAGLGALAGVLVAGIAAAQASECAALGEVAARPLAERSRADWQALADQARRLACGGEAVVESLGRRTASAWWNEIVQRLQRGERAAMMTADLVALLGYGDVWQAQATLGDVHVEQGDAARAAHRYQLALDAIADMRATPREPPREVVRQIFAKAEQSRLLADGYVPNTRSGTVPTGLGAPMVRSYAVEKVALPIEFRFNSTELTERGQEALADLVDMLKTERPSRIGLVGHTDTCGSAEYNRQLSENRARAVKAALEERLRDYFAAESHRLTIDASGRGFDEPPLINPPARAPSPALRSGCESEPAYRIFRRVEYVRGSGS